MRTMGEKLYGYEMSKKGNTNMGCYCLSNNTDTVITQTCIDNA